MVALSHRLTFRPRTMVLLVTVAIGFVLLLLPGGGTYQVRAEFDQVYGLIPGGRVTAGGIQVGTVSAIGLTRDDYPIVTMQVDDNFRLHGGASAAVRPFSLSGEVSREVELTPGSGPVLSGRIFIGRDHTSSVQELDQVLSALDRATRAEVRLLLARFDAATRGRGADIAAALRTSGDALGQTADVAGELASDTGALRSLVDHAQSVVSALSASPGSLSVFAERFSGLLHTTAARQQQLNEMISLLPGGLRAGGAALQRLDGSVSTLRQFVGDAQPGVTELRAVLPDLRNLFARAAPPLATVASLARSAPTELRQMAPLLSTARPVLSAFVPALTQLLPVANQTRARLPDAFAFFSNWADFMSNYDANGHGGRVGLVFTNPPRTPRGPADARPGRLDRPFLRDPGVLEGEPWSDYQRSFLKAGQ